MLHSSLLPLLPSLLAFEAAARHESVSRASEELHLTQSAVSRRIRQLESFLGVPLFLRVRQRIVLTDGGRLYAADVRSALDALAGATQSAMSFTGHNSLNLAVLPTFGARWLIPRLPDFSRANPGVVVNVASRLRPFDFEAEPFDAAIHYGAPHWPGAVCHHLFEEDVVAVASPGYCKREHMARPADLARATYLQQVTRPMLWTQWLQSAGVADTNALRGPRFEQFAMVAEAAIAGLGAALVPRFLVQEELRSGRLVQVGKHKLAGLGSYYLVCPEKRAGLPVVEAFRAWIVAQAARKR